MSQSQIETKK